MRTPPPSSSPIDLARESLRMDKDTGDKTFRIMAIGMMFVTALATATHALSSIYRDMRGRREGREYGHGDRRSDRPREAPEYNYSARGEAAGQHEESGQERSWSRREERRGRTPEGEEGWTDHRRQLGHGRER
jgi:hypothetical protein